MPVEKMGISHATLTNYYTKIKKTYSPAYSFSSFISGNKEKKLHKCLSFK